MKKLIIIVGLAALFTPTLAQADNYPWCPEDAVCSDLRTKKIIVYDPNKSFRQTSLFPRDVAITRQHPEAAKYFSQYEDPRFAPDVIHARQYVFRPNGQY